MATQTQVTGKQATATVATPTTTTAPLAVTTRTTVAAQKGQQLTCQNAVFTAPYTGNYTGSGLGLQWPNAGNPAWWHVCAASNGMAVILTRHNGGYKVYPYTGQQLVVTA